MPMRGLTIVIADAQPERLRTALMMAVTQAALGGEARLFCEGKSVALLRAPITGPEDAAHAKAGLPTLGELYAEALEQGVRIILCQSGMQLLGATPADYDPRADYGGMVSLMQSLGDDRLVVI
jgi:predicted peroxiredoxin